MALSTSDFGNSCLIFGTSDDLQPLVRLNQLLKPQPLSDPTDNRRARVFICVTGQPPTGAPFEGLLARMAALNSQYQAEAAVLTMVSPPRLIPMSEVVFSAAPLPFSVVPAAADATSRLVDGDSFLAMEVLLERRISGVRRLLRVVQLHADPVAMFWGLSQAGLVAPQVMVTVPALPLARKWGALERLLTQFRCALPKLWVRGNFPPADPGAKTDLPTSVLPTATPLYPRRACVFHGWDASLGVVSPFMPSADVDASEGQVAGFAPDTRDFKIVIDHIERRGGRRGVSLNRSGGNFGFRRALFIVAGSQARGEACPDDSTLACWEEILARHMGASRAQALPYPLASAIGVARATARGLQLRLVVMQVPSFEDEVAVEVTRLAAARSNVQVVIVTDHCLGVFGVGDIRGALRAEPWVG